VPIAEYEAAGQGEDEGEDAGKQERIAQLVQECLRWRPVLKQHEEADFGRALIAEQRKRSLDKLPFSDLSQRRGDTLRTSQLAGGKSRYHLPLFDVAEAAASELVARDEIDVGACDLRELLGDAIVQAEPERDGAQDFSLGKFRGLGSHEK
jgi:hypothetical protein